MSGLKICLFLLADRRRPKIGFGAGHIAFGQKPGIEITPLLDVDEKLLARKKRSLADARFGRRRSHLFSQRIGQSVHDARGNIRAMRRIDETEQQKVAVENAPMRTEPTQKPLPVELFRARAEEMRDI